MTFFLFRLHLINIKRLYYISIVEKRKENLWKLEQRKVFYIEYCNYYLF